MRMLQLTIFVNEFIMFADALWSGRKISTFHNQFANASSSLLP
jgi:hypothetical protein